MVQEEELTVLRLIQIGSFYLLLLSIVLIGARAFWLAHLSERELAYAASAHAKTVGLSFVFLGFLILLLISIPIAVGQHLLIRGFLFYGAMVLEFLGLWLLGNGFLITIWNLRSLTGARNLLVEGTIGEQGLSALDVARRAMAEKLAQPDLDPGDRMGLSLAVERIEGVTRHDAGPH